MDRHPIASVAWGLPDDWLQWQHGDLSRAVDEVSALGEDSTTSEAVLAAIRTFEAIIASDVPGTTFAAIWTPVAGLRQPLASATLRIGAAPDAGRMDLQTLLDLVRERARAPRGMRVLDVAALPSRVTAGDAVLRVIDKAPRFRRQVSREWTWFIQPRGTDETVVCQVESTSIAHFDHIAEMTTAIAHSVTVTLEPA